MIVRTRTTLVLALLGMVAAAIALFPYAVMLLTSLKSNSDLYAIPATILPTEWRWQNYIDIWSESDIGLWLRNSIFITVISTCATLVIAAPAAYFLARHDFRAKRVIMLTLLIGQMITPTVVLVGLFRQFLALGLVNTHAALIITNVAFHLSFAVWLLTSFFRSVPAEIFEASFIDGCGDLRTLIQILLPIAAPGVVTAAIFTFVSVWNEYVVALLLIRDRTLLPLSVGITSFTGQYQVEWQFLFTTAVIAILPVVVMFASVERNLVGGLSAGAGK